jgi:hypothetical protein
MFIQCCSFLHSKRPTEKKRQSKQEKPAFVYPSGSCEKNGQFLF